MNKFKINDFVYSIPIKNADPFFDIKALRVVGYDEKRNKYICLCYGYDIPQILTLHKEEELALMTKEEIDDCLTEDYAKRIISDEFKHLDFYRYPLCDVEGTEITEIRGTIIKDKEWWIENSR